MEEQKHIISKEEAPSQTDQDECSQTDSDFTESQQFVLRQTRRRTKQQRSRPLQKQSKPIRKSERARKSSKSYSEKVEVDGQRGFLCKECQRCFETSQQLGGHTSKMHPGKSDSYNNKIETWESRKFQRFWLEKARQMVRELHPRLDQAATDQQKKERQSKLKFYKKRIRDQALKDYQKEVDPAFTIDQ